MGWWQYLTFKKIHPKKEVISRYVLGIDLCAETKFNSYVIRLRHVNDCRRMRSSLSWFIWRCRFVPFTISVFGNLKTTKLNNKLQRTDTSISRIYVVQERMKEGFQNYFLVHT